MLKPWGVPSMDVGVAVSLRGADGHVPLGRRADLVPQGVKRVQPLVRHEPIPLVDLALPAEGVDRLGRHVDHLAWRGRHIANGFETVA